MGIIDRKTYKKIEYYFYNYYAIRRELQYRKEDIIEEARPAVGEWGGGISYHSDPTASKAIKLCKDNIMEDEKWVRVVERTIAKFKGTGKGRLLQKKYFDELGEIHICRELHIERATYFNWRTEIILYAAMLAAQEGLLKV
ncbi:DUF1492 domain-containing protein [Lutispora sp.]|uniref:DUF1492 domain-containing protein n=1 Tax=Lutispora sp. TaxID=2828727 RepID=UPI002B1EC27D|nr:DUF1492 domain-containing protein [Lutispora sp.]MEA4960367.1 DUF1492 domain-containing protein [Lutispora sp.]